MAQVRGQRFLDRVAKLPKLEVSVMASSSPITVKHHSTLREHVKHQLDLMWKDWSTPWTREDIYVTMTMGAMGAAALWYFMGRGQIVEAIVSMVMLAMTGWVILPNMGERR